uniref:Prokineticin 1 n=1 Tax=Anas platyrhynchos TaxID=8839 RepID=A0A8B9R2C7_ANAPL
MRVDDGLVVFFFPHPTWGKYFFYDVKRFRSHLLILRSSGGDKKKKQTHWRRGQGVYRVQDCSRHRQTAPCDGSCRPSSCSCCCPCSVALSSRGPASGTCSAGSGTCCAVSLWLRGLRMCTPLGQQGDECHPFSHKVPFLGKRQHHTCPCLPNFICSRFLDGRYRCSLDFKNIDF